MPTISSDISVENCKNDEVEALEPFSVQTNADSHGHTVRVVESSSEMLRCPEFYPQNREGGVYFLLRWSFVEIFSLVLNKLGIPLLHC